MPVPSAKAIGAQLQRGLAGLAAWPVARSWCGAVRSCRLGRPALGRRRSAAGLAGRVPLGQLGHAVGRDPKDRTGSRAAVGAVRAAVGAARWPLGQLGHLVIENKSLPTDVLVYPTVYLYSILQLNLIQPKP